MHKHEKYMKKLLNVQDSHHKMMNQIVINAIKEEEDLVHKLLEEENNVQLTIGQKIADVISNFGGSWSFIILFFIMLFSWMFINSSMEAHAFDPYPFIFLNLVLSCLAAVQAPIILMSQNRKETRDNKRSQDSYLINLKSELENRAMDQKLNLLINQEFRELIEIQKIQISKMNDIEAAIKKLQKPEKK